MIVENRRTHFQHLDALAKDIAECENNGNRMSEVLLRITSDLYIAAKVEKEFDGENFSSAYHSPITGDLEFLVGRILFHFSELNNLNWTIHVRRQKASTAPDIRIDKCGATVGIIEIKAKAGWMQSFFSPEQYARDKAKFDAESGEYDPDAGNLRSKNQLTKYGSAFGIGPESIFLLLPTLALVHRKKSTLSIQDYRKYFAETSAIPAENLVLLSSNLSLDLSYRMGNLDPTGDFEGMLKKLVDRSETLPILPPNLSRDGAILIQPSAVTRIRANSKSFISSKHSNLFHLPRRTSRMWESSESELYKDNWWFSFYLHNLENAEAIILAGARDYLNKDFTLLKVPRSFILDNLQRLDVNRDGCVNLYIGMKDYIDQRMEDGLSFKPFLVN